MPTSYPPKIIPSKLGLISPIRRPFNVDKECVVCLIPEINTQWLDYSGNGNHATLTNGVIGSNGRLGQCLLFDDTARYGTITDNASIELGATATWEIWIYPASVVGNYGLFDKYLTTGNQRSYRIQQASEHMSIQVSSDGIAADNDSSDNFLTANKWWHLVITFDNGAWAIYANGTSITGCDALAQTSIFNATRELRIGTYAANYFDGRIDEVRIYNRVLAEWEAKALYEQGKPS